MRADALEARRPEHDGIIVEEQQWEQAIAAYGEAVAARPDDPLLAGKLDSARRAGAAAYHVEARKAEQSGDLVAALAAYDKALQLLPAHDGARTDGSKVRRLLRITENRVDEARARLAAGDCLGAKADLEGLYAYKQAFPVIEEARVAALEACFGKAVAAAGVLFALGDVTAAEAMLAEADAYYPGHPQVAALRAEASGTRAAEELAMQGHAALVDGDLDAALKAYRDSLARDPSRQDSTRGLQAAAARKVDQHLKGVSRLHRAGRWQEVLAAIQAALAVGLPDEQVRGEGGGPTLPGCSARPGSGSGWPSSSASPSPTQSSRPGSPWPAWTGSCPTASCSCRRPTDPSTAAWGPRSHST